MTNMLHTFKSVSKIVHGAGSIADAGKEVKRLGGKRAIIVTDPGLASLGLHIAVEEALAHAGIEFVLYAKAELEPNATSIQHCADVAKEFKADVIIGFGGGSALDTAKAASVLAVHEGPISKYFGVDVVPGPCMPLIAVPTTAGTGSEMTSISVLTNNETGAKLGIVSDYIYASAVILDPALTTGLPPHITAMTGVDAFVHAMESFVGLMSTPFTDALNLQAMKIIAKNIRKAYANGNNLEAREAMLYGSALAGMGFGNTQNGVIHAVGTSVPAKYKLPHGLLMAAVAPIGIDYNYMSNPEKYAVVADILSHVVESDEPVEDRAAYCADAFVQMLEDLDIAPGLAPYGVTAEDLPGIATRAAAAKRLMDNNPRQGNEKQLLTMLEKHF
ncbi:related to 1,3-propanediol dehydrogenase [Desulfotalea psychrophila LSv54]|uniref:Related to 1,3-propanediol dehydrogenase n=2 Tax=Desulfotalea psychrophila TaxID=84980 RepID=Q6AQV2_DESPS|nr:related to 1,3-propanediol dehydrogenase [Desulfotalea psychrophila LSv54]